MDFTKGSLVMNNPLFNGDNNNYNNSESISQTSQEQNPTVNTSLTKEYLESLNNDYYKLLDKQFENVYIDNQMATDIDIIRFKVECYYYTHINEVIEDVNFMFKCCYQNLTEITNLSKKYDITVYRNYLTTTYLELIKSLYAFKKEYKMLYRKDINELILNNKMPRLSK
jgi:hypothetical protein